jgi:hypothetical protein
VRQARHRVHIQPESYSVGVAGSGSRAGRPRPQSPDPLDCAGNRRRLLNCLAPARHQHFYIVDQGEPSALSLLPHLLRNFDGYLHTNQTASSSHIVMCAALAMVCMETDHSMGGFDGRLKEVAGGRIVARGRMLWAFHARWLALAAAGR